MAFGVDSTGFTPKRLPDIKSDIENGLIDAFGQIDTDPESVFGQCIGVMSNTVADIWEQLENIYNSAYPDSAEGGSLDNAVSLVGVNRLAATPTTAVVQMRGTTSTSVPAGTAFSQSIAGTVFETDSTKVISLSSVHNTTITNAGNDSTTYTVTINGVAETYVSAATGTTAVLVSEQLRDTINADTSVNEEVIASVVGDDLVINYIDLTAEDSFTLSVNANLTIDEYWTPVPVTATTFGKLPAPAGSIDTIDTAVAGLDEVQNLAIGAIGREVETDTALRIRRRQRISTPGASTLAAIKSNLLTDVDDVTAVYAHENDTNVTDVDGRPPHSIEIVVNAPNVASVNQAIGESIFSRKAAGIETYGDTTVTVQDVNLQNHLVSFTHTATQYIWLRLTCLKTGSDKAFPSDGADQIREEALRLGNLLSIGDDVLLQVFAAAGYVAGGITSVAVEVAATTTPGGTPSYGSSNLSIGPEEVPDFDLDRITVIVS